MNLRVEEDHDRVAFAAAVVARQVHFELVRRVFLVGLGVEQVQGARPVVRRTVLQRRHHRVALDLTGAAQRLDAVGEERAFRHAVAETVAIRAGRRAPRLVQADLVLLDRQLRVRVTDREPERAVHELADVAGVDAIAVAVGVGGVAQRIALVAAAYRDDRLVVVERAHGAHVDRARQALADEAGIGRLVHGHAAHQLGGILVELDAAVVAGGHHLAAVEQRGGEVRRQAAHADHLRATAHALRGQAGQAGDGFGDAHVGQLADVFGGHRFDDGRRLLLGVDRGLDAGADAGDDDRIERPGFVGTRRLAFRCLRGHLGLRAGGEQHRCRCERHAQQIALELHLPSHSIDSGESGSSRCVSARVRRDGCRARREPAPESAKKNRSGRSGDGSSPHPCTKFFAYVFIARLPA